MSYFAKINKLLDEGCVMSNLNCSDCKGTILYNTTQKSAMCCKCDKIMYVEIQKEEQNHDTIDEEPNMVTQVSKQNYEDGSKKIGDLLLQGWCMKETSCKKCLMPNMESRQKELVCVICGPVIQPGKETSHSIKEQVQNNIIIYTPNKQKKEESQNLNYLVTKNKKIVKGSASPRGFDNTSEINSELSQNFPAFQYSGICKELHFLPNNPSQLCKRDQTNYVSNEIQYQVEKKYRTQSTYFP